VRRYWPNNQHDAAGLTYAHCTKATPGKPDTAPNTAYVLCSVPFTMYRVGTNPLIAGDADTFDVEVNGAVIGSGDTKDDALADARYRLMDTSRTAAGFTYEPPLNGTKK